MAAVPDSDDRENITNYEGAFLTRNQIKRISRGLPIIRPPSPPNHTSSDSSTSTSDTDAELPPEMKKGAAKKKKLSKKAKDKSQPISKSKTPTTKKEPVPQQSKNQSDDEADKFEEFKHLFDSREEYNKLMEGSEREREQIIFERLEQFENNKQRAQIEASLARSKRDIEDPTSDKDPTKDKNPHRKSLKKSSTKPPPLPMKPFTRPVVWSGDSESDPEGPSSYSSSTISNDSSDEEEQGPPIALKPVEAMEELTKARVSRHFLNSIIHTPFFNEVAIGAYVSINHGPSVQSTSDFRIVKIVDVVEDKPYTVERTRTNKLLKTIWGQTIRSYRINVVSNSPFSPLPFSEWKEQTIKHGELPTLRDIEQKERQITDSRQINYTPEMVNEKKKHQLGHNNFAMQKAELLRKRQYLEESGRKEEAAEVVKKIKLMETLNDVSNQSRSNNTDRINLINKRNRKQQQQKFFAGQIKFDFNDKNDPFTRKNEKMRVVCGTSKSNEEKNVQKTAVIMSKEQPIEIAQDRNAKMEAEQKENIPALIVNTTASQTPKVFSKGENKQTPKDFTDIYDLHKSISFDIDIGVPTTPNSSLHEVQDVPISAPNYIALSAIK